MDDDDDESTKLDDQQHGRFQCAEMKKNYDDNDTIENQSLHIYIYNFPCSMAYVYIYI